jgi:hypothetical protein
MNQDLKSQWVRLEKLREQYQEAIAQASPVQQHYQPEQKSWNMLQVMQHLVMSEKLSMDYLISKNYSNARKPTGITAVMRSIGMRILLRSPVKIKAPPIAGLESLNELDAENLMQEWQKVRAAMYEYLIFFPEEKISFSIFRHPRAGWLNIRQALSFFEDHLLHHQYQLQRIRKTAGFPR